jgi:hypothetical protein
VRIVRRASGANSVKSVRMDSQSLNAPKRGVIGNQRFAKISSNSGNQRIGLSQARADRDQFTINIPSAVSRFWKKAVRAEHIQKRARIIAVLKTGAEFGD